MRKSIHGKDERDGPRNIKLTAPPGAGYRKLRIGWWMDMSITEKDGTEKIKGNPKWLTKVVAWRWYCVSNVALRGGGVQRTWRSGLSGNLTERKLMAV
jgi:hypothetical protein